ncbi:trimethylamine methyltransferase family protein [Candidatus Formimonas warabiya]|uniref:Trimethylamine methyltransferase n=1 Tax=Formimonas warabiya TaxID=1761012 RepID=A0A3G1KV93_FORW1|nr:trimethylamine methyltransferase family protein [Candidatus Formimonas warabiya]ATW26369.1 trimethylamine methyltransferase [Candidatus Formimonas warabiya]
MAKMRIEVLSHEEMETIFAGALTVLEGTGVKVYSEEACRLLAEAGCQVEDHLVKIPEAVVRKAIESAPSCIDIYNREGELAMQLSGHNSYFGPGVTCPYFFDPVTMERKPATKKNVVDVAKVADALKNVDFLMSLCMVGDETPELADLHEVHAMIQNSTKPILSWAFTKENLSDIIDMCAEAVGGMDCLRAKPNLIMYAEPTTPLVHTKEAVEKLMLLARKGIPAVYSPGMTLGGTTPITIAGALTVGLSEGLTGVVISQLVNPGAPIITSANAGALDMSTLQAAYGSPEMCLEDAAATQIYRWLGIPTFGLAGATDAKVIDAQAIAEVTMEIIFSLGSGANLVHDLGMMDIGMTGSIHLLTICDEIVGMARRLSEGVIVDEDRMAAEMIHEVGPGGNFIVQEHTVKYLRSVLFRPELATRAIYDAWQKDGGKTMQDKAYEKVQRILSEHKPKPLEQSKKEKIDAILARAEARLGRGKN